MANWNDEMFLFVAVKYQSFLLTYSKVNVKLLRLLVYTKYVIAHIILSAIYCLFIKGYMFQEAHF